MSIVEHSEPVEARRHHVTEPAELCKPEWQDINISKSFQATITVTEGCILTCRPEGRATPKELERLSDLKSSVADDVVGSRCFVRIENFLHLKCSSFGALENYFKKLNDRDLGVICFGLSPLSKFMISIGQTLGLLKTNVKIVQNYSKAVKCAFELLGDKDGEFIHKKISEGPDLLQSFKDESDSFQVLTKPEWDLHLDGYTVKYELIDGNILHSISSGYFAKRHVDAVARLRREASESASPAGGIKYILAGMSDATGVSRKARKIYMESIG